MTVTFASWDWQSTLWLAFWLLFPLGADQLRRLLAARYPSAIDWYEEINPWLYGLLPAFGAWFSGMLPGRLLGFNGRGGPLGWAIVGLLLVGLWLTYWKFLLPRASIELPELRPEHGLLPEPRWAFYRGIGWLWLGDFWWGMLLGLLFSLAEWSLQHKPWLGENRQKNEVCFDLAFRATSSLAFAVSANLWFTMIFQAALLWPLLEKERDE